jgi:hypothetical protein
MLSLNEILMTLGGVLAIITVALHAYAHWSIRNIDRNQETEDQEGTFLGHPDLTAQSGDMSAIPAHPQDATRRQR